MSYNHAHIRYEQWFLPQKNFVLYSATSKYNERLYAVIFPWWRTDGDYQYYRSAYVSSSDETHLVSGEVSEAAFQNYLNYEDGLGKHCGLLISDMATGIIDTDPETYPDYPTSGDYQTYAYFDYINFESVSVWGGKYKFTVDIPIFDMTKQDSWTSLNNYIATGDDSGADNYENLHPVELHTDVWLDGKYPSIYLKTEIVEGELNRQINVKIVGNVSSYSPVELYNKNVPINEMKFLTFADYGNVESVTEYEIQFCRVDKISTLQDIANWTCTLNFSLDNNTGVVISPTTHDSRNGYHTISVEDGVPTDEDYDDENDEWKHNQTHNGFSGANTLTKTYMLDDTKLRALGNFLWSSTFKDNIFSLTQYPLDNIVSLKAMPLISTGAESEIKIGNVATGINAPVINLSDGIETTVGECVVDRVFKNFIDFSDFEMSIYLPFIGFKSIDPSLCMNRKLRVKYYFDTILGNCLATLEMADSNGNYIMNNAWQGNCGIDIAITATNRTQIENGYIGSALNAIGSLLSKNPLSLVGDVFKATTQEFHSESNGVGNPSLMNKLDTTCYIFVKRPQKHTPSHYGHHFGVPWYKYVNRLDSCRGFTKTHKFVCSEIKNALDGEKAEIEQLLNNGVFID